MKNKNEQDILMSHNYDGIRELDNDLPPWWLWLFYITIGFAVVYMIHYHVLGTGDLMIAEYHKEYDKNWEPGKAVQTGSGALEYRSPFYRSEEYSTPLQIKERLAVLDAERAQLLTQLSIKEGAAAVDAGGLPVNAMNFEELLAAAMLKASPEDLGRLQTEFPKAWELAQKSGGPGAGDAAAASVPEEKQIQPLTDKASLEAGKLVYTTNCLACHGANGEGGIGPNMTDEYWIHGAGMNNMIHTINVGVPAKGMITWKGVLKDEQILQVASYILTMYGTNPPNAKAPQGDKVDMQAVLNRTAGSEM